jgi:hypothetical protein
MTRDTQIADAIECDVEGDRARDATRWPDRFMLLLELLSDRGIGHIWVEQRIGARFVELETAELDEIIAGLEHVSRPSVLVDEILPAIRKRIRS